MGRKKIKYEESKMKKGCFETSTKKILNGRRRYTENGRKEECFLRKKTNIKNHNSSKLH